MSFAVPARPAAAADPPVPVPVLTAPPAGLFGHALWDSWFDLSSFGYEEQELFVSGTAIDAGGTPAAYTTRIIVTRPTDPARFNGVVLLDWVNVTAQFENAVDTILARPMLLREGYAYVHMSAQQAGLCCLPAFTPKLWDPVRYAAISHPGDAWSFDIVTQIAQAFRTPPAGGSLDPMGPLGVGRVRRVLAAGQSQSGIRLHDYLESWLPNHPSAVGIIDGVLVHGDVGQPKTFTHPLPVPVIKLLSDFEAVDDGVDPADLDPNLRLWEVAGSAHADHWIGYQSVFGMGPRLAGGPPMARAQHDAVLQAAGNYGEQIVPTLAACVVAGAAMPMHAATSTALHQLARWADGGPAPRHGPRFQFAGGQLAKDADGNTLGGIRLPPIDVPVATYLSTACALGGLTLPFTDLQLQQRYGTHAEYHRQMAARSDAAVRDGWLLPEDAIDLMAHACGARNRFPPTAEPCAPYTPPAFDTRPAAEATPVTTTAPPAVGPAGGPGDGGRIPATGASVPALAAALALASALALAAIRRRAT
jgi:hypothetical protein